MIGMILAHVNVKRLVWTTLCVFGFIFAINFLIHGVCLKDSYMQMAQLWRPEAEMNAKMLWMLLGQFVIAKAFCVIFALGYEGKGIGEGIRYGVLMGSFSAGPFFINYAVSPIPQCLMWCWIAGVIAQCIGSGIVASLVYKK